MFNGKKRVSGLDYPVLLSSFVKRRDVALKDILLSIGSSCRKSFITLEDPSEVWTKLETMYRGVEDACIDTYLVQMHTFRMRPDERVMRYVNRLIALQNDLAALGHNITEE